MAAILSMVLMRTMFALRSLLLLTLGAIQCTLVICAACIGAAHLMRGTF